MSSSASPHSDQSGVARAVARLRAEISRLKVGDRVPSSRFLMRELGIGPETVRRAVAQLVSEGALATRPGAGTFVSRGKLGLPGDTGWQRLALGSSPVQLAGLEELSEHAGPHSLSLDGNTLDHMLRPEDRIARAMCRAARRPGAWSPPPYGGLPDLRSWFARELGVEKENVWISGGCQSALSAAMRAIVPSGSPVLFEVPTYPGAVAVARSAGMVPVPVPADENGVLPDLLARAFEQTASRVAYLQPRYANPDGRVLSEERRSQVLDVAHRAQAFVIEDDWAHWLGHEQPPAPPLIAGDANGHVVTVLSLTKSTAPSFRVGAMVARGLVLQRLARMRSVDDLFVPCVLQEAAMELVNGPGWQSHVRALSNALRQRMSELQVSLARHLPRLRYNTVRGGFFVWLELPSGCDADVLARHAASLDVAITSGRIFELGEPEVSHVRLSVAQIDPSLIDEAVCRLAQAFELSAR